MHALLPLIEQALVSAVVSQKAPFMRKSKLGLSLMALSGLLFCVALIWVMIAGYGWLLTQFEQPVAALIVAGFVLGFGIITLLSSFILLKNNHNAASSSDDISEMMSVIADFIDEELAESIQDNPKTAMLLASAAGFIAGDYIN